MLSSTTRVSHRSFTICCDMFNICMNSRPLLPFTARQQSCMTHYLATILRGCSLRTEKLHNCIMLDPATSQCNSNATRLRNIVKEPVAAVRSGQLLHRSAQLIDIATDPQPDYCSLQPAVSRKTRERRTFTRFALLSTARDLLSRRCFSRAAVADSARPFPTASELEKCLDCQSPERPQQPTCVVWYDKERGVGGRSGKRM